jgi:guanine nucleotide-binding protein subunit alpha
MWCEYMFIVPLFSLGSGESGKSTIVKQMKIIHQNGYSHDELIAFRPLIWKNLLESARDIVQALRKFNLEPITPANKVGRSINLLFCIAHLLFHRQIVIVS